MIISACFPLLFCRYHVLFIQWYISTNGREKRSTPANGMFFCYSRARRREESEDEGKRQGRKGESHRKSAKYEKKKIMDAPRPVDSSAAVDAWTISRARSACYVRYHYMQ